MFRIHFNLKDVFYNFCKKNKWKLLILLLIIAAIKGIISNEFLKWLSIEQDSGPYLALTQANSFFGKYDVLIVLFFIFLFLFLLGLAFSFLDNLKAKLILVKHSSLNAMKIEVDKSELKDFYIKETNIDLADAFSSDYDLITKIKTAIDKQLTSVPAIQNFVKRGYALGYVGIAHTPLIFLFGFVLGDENKALLFHKRRDNNDDLFHLLPSQECAERLDKIEEHPPASDEVDSLILSISTTFDIQDEEFKYIRNRNDYVLKYKTLNTGYDVIYSSKQINDYVNRIHEEVSRICKKYGIMKIKLCISSSVAFTFALAQSFSPNHDPELIVYNYVKTDPLKYPWGIDITHNLPVITSQETQE